MTTNDNGDLLRIFRQTQIPGVSSHTSSLLAGNTTSGAIPYALSLRPPKADLSHLQRAHERFDRRLADCSIESRVVAGRVVPDHDDLRIGAGRHLQLAVLFLDICRFSQIPSETESEQESVVQLLNLFMAEMLEVVRSHAGIFEKNTGDGLMAYFEGSSRSESTQDAVNAAVTMHYFNDQVISPGLRRMGLPEIKFRVGIDCGLVTIANVGIRGGDHRSLVAIGTQANIACKMMNLIPNGGIVLGNAVYAELRHLWKQETSKIGDVPGYVIQNTATPYPAFELKYRVPSTPASLLAVYKAMSGLG
jgi:adenylate cyclase